MRLNVYKLRTEDLQHSQYLAETTHHHIQHNCRAEKSELSKFRGTDALRCIQNPELSLRCHKVVSRLVSDSCFRNILPCLRSPSLMIPLLANLAAKAAGKGMAKSLQTKRPLQNTPLSSVSRNSDLQNFGDLEQQMEPCARGPCPPSYFAAPGLAERDSAQQPQRHLRTANMAVWPFARRLASLSLKTKYLQPNAQIGAENLFSVRRRYLSQVRWCTF